jgi:hypothetical protein
MINKNLEIIWYIFWVRSTGGLHALKSTLVLFSLYIYVCVCWESLVMDYFDNLDNGFHNKYKKILKIEKNFIDIFFSLINWQWFKFHTISLSFDTPSKTIKFYIIYNDYNLMVFDGVSNDNKIASNSNNYQSISKIIYFFFYF